MTANKDRAYRKNKRSSNNTVKSVKAKQTRKDTSSNQENETFLNKGQEIVRGKGKRPGEFRKGSEKSMPESPQAKRKAMKENNSFLASFPEMNINPIMELDLEGNLKYLNPACKRIFPDLTTFGLNHPFFS